MPSVATDTRSRLRRPWLSSTTHRPLPDRRSRKHRWTARSRRHPAGAASSDPRRSSSTRSRSTISSAIPERPSSTPAPSSPPPCPRPNARLATGSTSPGPSTSGISQNAATGPSWQPSEPRPKRSDAPPCNTSPQASCATTALCPAYAPSPPASTHSPEATQPLKPQAHRRAVSGRQFLMSRVGAGLRASGLGRPVDGGVGPVSVTGEEMEHSQSAVDQPEAVPGQGDAGGMPPGQLADLLARAPMACQAAVLGPPTCQPGWVRFSGSTWEDPRVVTTRSPMASFPFLHLTPIPYVPASALSGTVNWPTATSL